jgi:GcrA cell cycle regulator
MAAATWTDARVQALKRLWAEGFSAAETAARLGGVTRNAVIGKLHRLGLSGRRPTTPARRPRGEGPRPARRTAVRAPRPAACAAPPAAPEAAGRVPDLLGLRPGLCRWPIGDPRSSAFSFCGAGCGRLGPYCPAHRRRAHVRRRRRAATARGGPAG